jgi:hypothetical protein
MSKPVHPVTETLRWTKVSDTARDDWPQTLVACRNLTDAIYSGLDVSSGIRSVREQRLGDTVLVWRDSRLAGFAVCHCGAGTEAGSATCYIKFGAVRPSTTAAEDFDALLAASEALAKNAGASRVAAGVNMARHEAYTQLLNSGFRTDMQGVAMQRPNEEGYNRPGVFLLDDWR